VAGSDLHLVVGLGNPGPKYALTRHNFGALVVDELARRGGLASFTLAARPQVLIGSIRLGLLVGGVPGPRVVLAKPTTYMNRSGGAVRAVAERFEVPPERIVVVHDDIDLPLGAIRIKSDGRSGGHKGVKDVVHALGTRAFTRVRCGVGRPPEHVDPADFVLAAFPSAQRDQVDQAIDRAADAVERLVLEGLAQAQQAFNGPVAPA
jgi:PTH1 family peptidyl-tRNA hydrolase